MPKDENEEYPLMESFQTETMNDYVRFMVRIPMDGWGNLFIGFQIKNNDGDWVDGCGIITLDVTDIPLLIAVLQKIQEGYDHAD